jgi:hypothetical protein
VAFDGVDDYMLLPVVQDIRSISMWVKKEADENQPGLASGPIYLIDGRPGNPEAYFSNT